LSPKVNGVQGRPSSLINLISVLIESEFLMRGDWKSCDCRPWSCCRCETKPRLLL